MHKQKINLFADSPKKSESSQEPDKPKHMHRRTISKTSDELLASLKIPSPPIVSRHQQITPQLIIAHLEKKGLNILKEEIEESVDYSDEENNIRSIIEQRKILSPISVPEFKSKKNKKKVVDVEKVSNNTSTTAFTVPEETNIDRMIYLLGHVFLVGNTNRSARNQVVELMQRSPEPFFTLILDQNANLQGVYYIEIALGYLHRIIGNDILPIVIPPRKVRTFLYYDTSKMTFHPSHPPKFDAVILK